MPISDKTVLIVEDGEAINKMLNFLFMSRGCVVESAHNGIDALEVLKKTSPDAILLDLMMPEMDGFEFLERLKDDDKYKYIPVIVLSALAEEKHKERLKAMGVNDYIEKPFKPADLVERVSKIICDVSV